MIFIYKIINKICWWLVLWSDERIDKKNQAIVNRSELKNNIIKYIPSAIVVIFFLCLAFFAYGPGCNGNIQDGFKQPVKKVVTKEDKEYKMLKKHFTWLQRDVYNYIKEESEKREIDHVFVMSVIQFESGSYCANKWEKMITVKSYAGARGVMQIMPFHAPNPDDLWDWKYNIKKGIWYLSACLDASGGNVKGAARRYNQGLYGNPRKYRNWKYVYRINNKYKKVLTEKVMVAKI